VFVGTSEAYGATFNAIDGPLREDAPLNPTSVYGASKAAADILVGQMAHDGLDAVRFRPFNHAGPGQTEAYVVSAFAAQVARIEAGLQEPVLRVGDLEPSRDFLDVRDVVEAYVRAVLLPPGSDAAGAAINLASGQPRRIRDVLSAILARSTVSISVEPDPQRMRASDTPFAVGDASRARAILDWTPSISFDAMIGSVLDHWRRVVAGQEAAEGFSAASASP
jgi:GDP-4-dehydro-6-deoxy-D-mannose reductase